MKRYLRLCSLILFPIAGASHAAVYYVSVNGKDNGAGSLAMPYRTVQKAADIMQPGDTCYIRGGTYREWVKPPRGGTSENLRIVYQAYPGEIPVIKGSERINNWVKETGTVWRADVADATFGSTNPYIINVGGDYLNFGGENHLGEVYLNGESLYEKTTRSTVDRETKTWFTSHAGSTTQIWANFGNADPNTSLTEINVRECVFAPTVLKLNYITVDGLTLQQAACNWVANTAMQRALLLTMAGHHWIIQNCRISDAKCAGMSSAHQGAPTTDINAVGHHLVRHNVIERNGESGISGFIGWSSSLIEGNLIQDINYKKQFGGYESGGIKFHLTVDLVIKNNIIRRVKSAPGAANFPGIWVDWSNQGIRITGNVLYDNDREAILLEMNRGVNLVDNNILIGTQINTCSERTVIAHNLFINSGITPAIGMPGGRTVGFYQPHTLTRLGPNASPSINLGDRLFNNIFIGMGPNPPYTTTDFQADYNVYYQGSAKIRGDSHSIVNVSFNGGFSKVDDSAGITLAFNTDDSPTKVGCPLIAHALIGVFPTVNQGIEDRDGNHITLDHDLVGTLRSAVHPTAGPFEQLKLGKNTLRITAGPQEESSVAIRNGTNKKGVKPTSPRGRLFDSNGKLILNPAKKFSKVFLFLK